MKRFLLLLALLPVLLSASGVRVLQVEYMVQSGPDLHKWQPDYSQFPGVKFILGTPSVATAFPGSSYHATRVLSILLDGPAKGHLESVTNSEAVTYTGASRGGPTALNGSTLRPSEKATWDMENHSWGGYDQLAMDPVTLDTVTFVDGARVITPTVYPGILAKFVERLERDNVVAVVACNNPSDPAKLKLLNGAQSPNMIRVASSSTGWLDIPGRGPDACDVIADNSYAAPVVGQTVIALIAWAKDNGVAYKAADVKKAIVSTVKRDSSGKPMLNHTGAMAAFQAIYKPTTPATPTPTPLPVKATVSQLGDVSAVVGQTVTFSVSATGGTQPYSFGWAKNNVEIPGATSSSLKLASVTLGDVGDYNALVLNPAGLAISNTAHLSVTAPAPTATPTPLPTPTPIPTPSPAQLRASAAVSVGGTYDAAAHSFTVPETKVRALSDALTAQGL
jgi:hypothetical protein